MKPQKIKVAEHLAKYGYITTAQYVDWKWGIKLTNRIGEIREMFGVDIEAKRVPWGKSHGTRYTVSAGDREKLQKALA
ncbi:MAG: hypothetical protein MJK13_16530 [Pseudomonadales bacterium]|nr:hypothetical protein [Pseudomonadales bacterium]